MKKNSVASLSQNKINIIGDNILQVNDVLRAYYILPLANYTITSSSGVLYNVDHLNRLIVNLSAQRPNVKFTIEKCQKIIKAENVYNNLLETIELYRPDYDMPEEFTSHITDNYQDYCLLAIDIQQTDTTDVEGYTFKETIKELIDKTASKLLDNANDSLDYEKIIEIERNIYMILKDRCVRASRELVFYNFVSKLYPMYEISYLQNEHLNDNNFGEVLGILQQTVEDNFGYFVMHNEGVDFFGLEPQTTYGCLLTIKEFPKTIYSSDFYMDYPGVQTNIEMLVKDDAKIKMKRVRASNRFELEQSLNSGSPPEELEETSTNVDIATRAILDLDEDRAICEFNCSILLVSADLLDLKQQVARTIAALRDRDILVAKSLTQAKSWLDEYVRLCPQKYNHIADSQFPLSFQQNNGATVGDFDATATVNGKKVKLNVPPIGEDI